MCLGISWSGSARFILLNQPNIKHRFDSFADGKLPVKTIWMHLVCAQGCECFEPNPFKPVPDLVSSECVVTWWCKVFLTVTARGAAGEMQELRKSVDGALGSDLGGQKTPRNSVSLPEWTEPCARLTLKSFSSRDRSPKRTKTKRRSHSAAENGSMLDSSTEGRSKAGCGR